MSIALHTAKPRDSKPFPKRPRPPARAGAKVVRDFAVLLGFAVTAGLTAALGMMMAVLVLS